MILTTSPFARHLYVRAGALLSGMTKGPAGSGDGHDDGEMHHVDGVRGGGLLGGGPGCGRLWPQRVCSAAPVTVCAKAWGCR